MIIIYTYTLYVYTYTHYYAYVTLLDDLASMAIVNVASNDDHNTNNADNPSNIKNKQ